MQWQVLVPIIVIAIFILINVFRTNEEQPRETRRRPMGGPRPPRGPDQLPSEVERFLEEIERMKRRAVDEKPRAVVEEPRPEPAPVPVPRVDRPQRPRTAPPPRRTRPGPLRERPIDVVPVPVLPPPLPPVVVEAVPLSQPVGAVGFAVQPVGAVSPAKAAPPVQQLRELMRTPKTLQTAVLLQEVLGPPRCRAARHSSPFRLRS
jgi:hypothetical protein